jgi:hypothetical protein
MRFTIVGLEAECKFCEAFTLEALGQVIPVEQVQAAVEPLRPGSRVRKLTVEVTLWLVLALHLFPRHSIPAVLRQLAHGQRLVWPEAEVVLPGASALAYRRAQLGARPVAALFHQVCRPLANPQAVGAFRFGRRLMGLDGTIENVPDSPANARVFGRRCSQHGPSVYPQVLAVYVVEVGTHAVVEAGFWPGPSSEHRAARRVVRALAPGMLLLWDRGFHSLGLLRAVQARGADVLGRLPAHVHPQLLRPLADGSALVWLRPVRGAQDAGAVREPGLRVRLISYRLSGPGAPREPIQLVTTLLDPTQAPAQALAATYHERWEVELTLDELDTHQRLATRTLRSLHPVGVVQELYGLLLAHYVVRTLMHAAALPRGLDPDRLSFTRALETVCAAILDFQLVPPSQWPTLSARLLADLAQTPLPPRRPRTAPRAVKRARSRYVQRRATYAATPRAPDAYADRIVLQTPRASPHLPLVAPACRRCVI